MPAARHLAGVAAALLALAAAASAQTTNLRIVAANTTSGNGQGYEDPGIRIFQALDADVVLIQEFNVGGSNNDAAVEAFVDSTFGTGFQWYREAGAQIPNGVISRYPIIASGEWDDTQVSNRDFAWARIDIPGDIDLWVVSVHFLTSGSGVRNTEAQLIVNTYLPTLGLPQNAYLAIGGDFNTDSRTESCISTLSARVVTSSPFPVGEDGSGNTNAGRSKPYDWMLANPNLDSREVTTTYGSFSYPNGLVFDTRDYSQAELNAAFSPALTGDSGATNMQHMAVLRTFAIPGGTGGGDDYSVSPTSVAFGTVNAMSGPFTNSTVTVTPANPVTLTGATFSGASASEFSLATPTLPAAIGSAQALAFRWTPVANDGATRNVTATITTNGSPASFNVSLSGTTQSSQGGPGGTPIDIGGYVVEQINSTRTYTIPANTMIQPGQVLVIGRDVNRAGFETAWSRTLAPDVLYLDSGDASIAINGDERFRLLNPSAQNVDPPTSGHVPAAGISTTNGYRRDTTAGTTFTAYPISTLGNATPGLYTGTRNNTGRVVITEFADAAEFANEFVELFYDAPPPTASGWILR
ncbi:MAG: endonuclease [Candidatus Sumerlaeia bacterium]|nr:endonuclease [Candidatus Sumerlaeia bacterium]